MGMASPGGKMAIHSNIYPVVTDSEKCLKCNRCAQNCPGGAITITETGPVLDTTKCVGCAKCLAECPIHLFQQNHANYNELTFLEKLVEYTKVMMDQKPMYYINVMANISPLCDCAAKAPKPFVGDVGAVASLDIVAIDQACHDLVSAAAGEDDVFKKLNHVDSQAQLDYAEKLGMGTTKYILIDVATGKQITVQQAVRKNK